MTNEENKEEQNASTLTQTTCRFCKQSIHHNASRCHICGSYQGYLRIFFTNIPLLTSIVLVLIAVAQVMIAYNQLIDARQKQIDATTALKKASNAENISLDSANHINKFEIQAKDKFIEISKVSKKIAEQSLQIDEIEKEANLLIESIRNMNEVSEFIQNNGWIAKIDFNGIYHVVGAKLDKNSISMTGATVLSRWNGGFVNMSNDDYKLIGENMCSDNAIEKYNSTIGNYPFWPYSHFMLALCLKAKSDQSWEKHAQHAVNIFKIISYIPDRHWHYDLFRSKLENMLKE